MLTNPPWTVGVTALIPELNTPDGFIGTAVHWALLWSDQLPNNAGPTNNAARERTWRRMFAIYTRNEELQPRHQVIGNLAPRSGFHLEKSE